MPDELNDDARELVELFAELPRDDRARVLALLRSLSLCRIAELYSTPWSEASAARDQGSGIRSTSLPVCDPCV